MSERITVLNQLPFEKSVIKVRIPSATTLYQGSQIVAESLENATTRSIYAGALPTDVTVDIPCIIFTQGVYEDANGARVEGYVDPGSVSYRAGDVVTALRPEKDLILTITNDCINGTPVKDQYLIPANAAEQLTVSATIPTTNVPKVIYKIEQLTTIPAGNTFVPAAMVRIILGR